MRDRRPREAGFALVNVLVILLALSAVAVQLLQDATRGTENVRMSRTADQLELFSQAGVAFATRLLERDMKAGDSDHRGEAWALDRFRAETADTAVTVTVRDLEARFNLNLLISQAPSAPEAALRALIDATGAAPELAGLLVARHAAFQPGPAAVDRGLADRTYLDGDLTHLGSFAPLVDDRARALADHVAVLPRGRGVNANTADATVLGAVLGIEAPAAAAMVALRDRSPFETVTDLEAALTAVAGPEAVVPAGLLGVSSNWFEIETEVTLDGLTHRAQTMVYRDQTSDEVVVFRRQADVTG